MRGHTARPRPPIEAISVGICPSGKLSPPSKAVCRLRRRR